ncbi:MAG: AAA family ATPase [Dehalococcoidia bacterium]
MTTSPLVISVENFGPVGKGEFEIRPLTVLIGPNNTGKSYLAVLVYAVLQGLAPRNWLRGLLVAPRITTETNGELVHTKSVIPEPRLTEARRRDLIKWLQGFERKSHVDIESAPKFITDLIDPMLARVSALLGDSIVSEIQRGFGSPLSELMRQPTSDHRMFLKISRTEPEWSLTFQGLERSQEEPSIVAKRDAARVPTSPLRGVRTDMDIQGSTLALKEAVWFILYHILWSYYDRLGPTTYYLPAARSGLIQSHRLLTSSLVERAPLVGIGSLAIPPLSGVVADFISLMLRAGAMRPSGGMQEIANELERNILKGEIVVEQMQSQMDEIRYQSDLGTFSLFRTSSMVSELAPVVLVIRRYLAAGDTLLIEEPEAHLHPSNQRKIADILVALVRAGVRVIMTTHSDLILQHFNNAVRKGSITRRRSQTRPLSNGELSTDEIGAYLVDWCGDRTSTGVTRLVIDPIDGIPDDSFASVHETLYEETLDLESRLAR